MKARNIKPGFFENEGLAQMSPHARLLFIGLWLLADRDGRLEDRPIRISKSIFPYEQINIEPLLDELTKFHDNGSPFIVRYTISGKNYIQITNFQKHQRPHPKEKSFGFPSPSDTSREIPQQKMEEKRTNQETFCQEMREKDTSREISQTNQETFCKKRMNDEYMNDEYMNDEYMNVEYMNVEYMNPGEVNNSGKDKPCSGEVQTPPCLADFKKEESSGAPRYQIEWAKKRKPGLQSLAQILKKMGLGRLGETECSSA